MEGAMKLFRVSVLILLSCAWVACGDDSEDNGGAGNNAQTNNAENNVNNAENNVNNAENNVNNAENNVNNAENNVNNAENNSTVEPGPYDGLYLLGISVAPLNGLILPFQMSVVSEAKEGGGAVLTTVELRAVGSGDALSEVLATLSDVEVGADGTFTAQTGEFTLPAAYTPTGSDVVVDVVFDGGVQEDGSFCGTIGGQIVTFEILLDGSAFGSVPWEERAEGAKGSCEDDGPVEIPRLEASACPEVVVGRNDGFMSAEHTRSFEVVAPDPAPPGPMPVLFVFHGFGGDIASILDDGALETIAQEEGMLVVVAQGEEISGRLGWDVVTPENPDVAFFDDMLTCVGESFEVDPSRVYVAGHSNGALFTSNLLRRRSEVVAAVAPISGGWFIDFEQTEVTPPVMVTWGGVADTAFEQDFNRLSEELIEVLGEGGHFVVACDHGEGHGFPAGTWESIARFLLDHPQGVEPEPYAGGLPEGFPDYCVIPGLE
jgi:predicted esterase